MNTDYLTLYNNLCHLFEETKKNGKRNRCPNKPTPHFQKVSRCKLNKARIPLRTLLRINLRHLSQISYRTPEMPKVTSRGPSVVLSGNQL